MTKLAYPLFYHRRQTKTVWVKNLPIGSEHPLVIQSMLTSQTNHPRACIAEMKKLKKAGCMLIRLAIPTRKSLEFMEEIKKLMNEEGLEMPLSADIHFAPHLALDACEFFDKIRINPGNFSDRAKNSSARSHLAFDLEEGKARFRERITPLVKILKEKNLALRVGVNQGSLSSRILQAYGDTPLGMVESALEAIDLFTQQGFEKIIVSLKSSNPLVVQKAYRLFCQKCSSQTPLHLGVTEAGNDTAGRSKSLVGIAPLLFDGIGDTIRISLTEDSVNEIIFAKKFLRNFSTSEKTTWQDENYFQDLKQYRVNNKPLLLTKINTRKKSLQLGGASNVKLGKTKELTLPEKDFFQHDFEYYIQGKCFFLEKQLKPLFLWKNASQKIPDLQNYTGVLIAISEPIRLIRKFYQDYQNFSLPIGLLLPPRSINTDYSLEIQNACLLGEGLLDFLLLHPKTTKTQLVRLSFLFQATKTKISRTEYIACPSCGRTLFDLQDVTKKIKAKTGHLKGVKIGIMGCMVNGPGEMADADFGYVGSGNGKIDLYLGHKKVRRSIDENLAVESLVELIKTQGKWVEA